MCTFKKARRSALLKIVTVSVILAVMFCFVSFPASAAETKYLLSSWTSKSISHKYFITLDNSGEPSADYIEDLAYSSTESIMIYNSPKNFDGYVLPSMGSDFVSNGTSADSLFLQSYHYLNKTVTPGSYQIQFTVGVPKQNFRGYRYYTDSNGNLLNGATCPALTYRDENGVYHDVLFQTVTSYVPSDSEYRYDTFAADVNFTTSTFLYRIHTRAAYQSQTGFNGWLQFFDSYGDNVYMFSSAIDLYSFTDNPAAVDKYNPPDDSFMDDYIEQDEAAQGFIDTNSAEVDRYLSGSALSDNLYLVQAMQGIDNVFKMITGQCPWLSTVIYISIGLGLGGFVLNLVSVVVRRRGG